jgi:hypothetical protein
MSSAMPYDNLWVMRAESRMRRVGVPVSHLLFGAIALSIVRIERSQKAQRGVHLADLADYIEKRRAAAIKECQQLTGQD